MWGKCIIDNAKGEMLQFLLSLNDVLMILHRLILFIYVYFQHYTLNIGPFLIIIIFIPEYGLLNLLHDPLQVSLIFILILILLIIMILITFLFYLHSNCFHSLHIKSVLLLNLNKLIG